ncbi:hypothetical protein DFH06DRAFT_1477516 [Mycena polygramma]|nr:hypothetical protein DFH06DRAFT_1477516 [Mycena polygramma]
MHARRRSRASHVHAHHPCSTDSGWRAQNAHVNLRGPSRPCSLALHCDRWCAGRAPSLQHRSTRRRAHVIYAESAQCGNNERGAPAPLFLFLVFFPLPVRTGSLRGSRARCPTPSPDVSRASSPAPTHWRLRHA